MPRLFADIYKRFHLNRFMVLVLVFAVFVRVIFLGWTLWFGNGVPALTFGDASGYVELAQNLAHGNGFRSMVDGQLVVQVFRTIALPLLIAPFMLIPHGVEWYSLLLAITAGILVPYLTYRLTESIVDVKEARVAMLLVAFEPSLIWFSCVPLSEMPFILFALSGFYLLYREWNGSWPMTVVGALLVGYAILIRPPFLMVFIGAGILTTLWYLIRREWTHAHRAAVILAVIILAIVPWSIRNHAYTQTYSISGMGWYNVYFDYLSSVVTIETGADYKATKIAREASPPPGVPLGEVSNPEYASLLRAAAFREMWEHRVTVAKLETTAMIAFLTNDSYYYYLRRYGFITEVPSEHGPRSVSLGLLRDGGMAHLISEAKRQFFIPIFGRLVTVSLLGFGAIGFFVNRRKPIFYLMAGIFCGAALVSTALGLAVEARLRVPVEPLLYIAASAGICAMIGLYAKFRHRRLHSRV